MAVTVTWDQASARRLERQFLARPAERGTPVGEVVGAMLGAHAQVLSAAEVSVGVRAAGVTRADVRAALWEDRSLVKTFGPRGTVHLLPAAELPLWCGALTATPTGRSPLPPDVRVTEEQAEQIVAAIGDALGGVCLTVEELGEAVVARTGSWAGDLVMPAFQDLWPRWRQVLHRAGHSGALCFGPNRGRKVTYTRPPEFDPGPVPGKAALRELVRRYLRAYGPATPLHFAKWLAATAGWAAALFTELAEAGEVEEVAFEGAAAWVAAGDTGFPVGRVPGVRLLPYFDAYAIAAQPRESLFPGEAYRRALAGGQAGNYPVLLVDGVVAGVWHQRRQGRRTTATVELIGRRRLTARQERELGEQVERVGEVLEAKAELVVGEVTVGPHA
ncbi:MULTISPECIES: winged helix DNA-binding domain-containing protein [unclassified Streptomyces]|uniref:winged helix DNA-binding domain-containing protein n=1 Tax=unclassified Streptomyces TaxID=2593676 RepID=UPI0023662B31|nr:MULTISPECIES: winged helix DNA-binding domain-containing protein [unclassified Streptomyces]MDF3141135.1 winged helix DNA-binding domain-containing protein [Streptomyces sp. T21Q-yed]WDF40934.1 winged helix DNA-binding domain-containing protein [Streptomyces sp. T12]